MPIYFFAAGWRSTSAWIQPERVVAMVFVIASSNLEIQKKICLLYSEVDYCNIPELYLLVFDRI